MRIPDPLSLQLQRLRKWVIVVMLCTQKTYPKVSFWGYLCLGTQTNFTAALFSHQKFLGYLKMRGTQKTFLFWLHKRLGATAVIENNSLIGIITDGDLRRMLEKGGVVNSLSAIDIMSKNPKTMDSKSLAYDGLKLMKKNKISQIIVLEKGEYAGIVHIHEIIKEGIV